MLLISPKFWGKDILANSPIFYAGNTSPIIHLQGLKREIPAKI